MLEIQGPILMGVPSRCEQCSNLVPGPLRKTGEGFPIHVIFPNIIIMMVEYHNQYLGSQWWWSWMGIYHINIYIYQYIYIYINITSYSNNGFTNILVNKNYHHHHHQPSSTIGSLRTTTRPPTISLQHLGAQRLASPWRWVIKWWFPSGGLGLPHYGWFISLKILLKWRISLRILLRIY